MKSFHVKDGERNFFAWAALAPSGEILGVFISKIEALDWTREYSEFDVPIGAHAIVKCTVAMKIKHGDQFKWPIVQRFLKRKLMEERARRSERRKRLKEFPPELSAPL